VAAPDETRSVFLGIYFVGVDRDTGRPHRRILSHDCCMIPHNILIGRQAGRAYLDWEGTERNGMLLGIPVGQVQDHDESREMANGRMWISQAGAEVNVLGRLV